jgi:hypothetical protein
MSESAAEYRERHSPRPGALRRLLVLLACLAYLLALIVVPLHIVGTMSLRRQMARMQQAGEPQTLQALLDARPHVPDEENSSLIMAGLLDDIAALNKRDERWFDVPWFGRPRRDFALHGPWTQRDVELMHGFTAAHADLIERLDAIGALPTGRYPLQANDRATLMQLPHLSAHRAAVRLEAMAVCIDLADGRSDAALDRCTTMLHIGRPLMEEPFTISALVAMACDTTGVTMIETVLASGQADAERMRKLDRTLREHQHAGDLKFALRGERLMQREILRGREFDQTMSTEFQFPVALSPVLRAGGLATINEAKSLELMTRLIDALDDPAAALRAAEEMEREITQFGLLHAPARMTMPTLTNMVATSLRHRVRLAAARAALAAECYRMDRGDWPLSLGALVPEYLDAVPIDHFDGRPLRLKRTDTGLVIYSIDRDGTDDGGDLDWTPGLKRKYGEHATDIGFRLLDPAYRGVRIVEGDEVESSESASE